MNTKNHIESAETSGTLSSFTFLQKVQFKHYDPAGIVFYPRFIEMINDAVEAMFDIVIDVEKLGRASMKLAITALSSGNTRFRGSMTLAYVDGDGRPQPWPDTAWARITQNGKLA